MHVNNILTSKPGTRQDPDSEMSEPVLCPSPDSGSGQWSLGKDKHQHIVYPKQLKEMPGGKLFGGHLEMALCDLLTDLGELVFHLFSCQVISLLS